MVCKRVSFQLKMATLVVCIRFCKHLIVLNGIVAHANSAKTNRLSKKKLRNLGNVLPRIVGPRYYLSRKMHTSLTTRDLSCDLARRLLFASALVHHHVEYELFRRPGVIIHKLRFSECIIP